MCRKKRIEYFICTMCVLITGFMIYGLAGSMEPTIYGSKIQSFFVFGCIGGFGFSMILSGIILAVRFLSKRSFTFKIISSALWIVTIACSVGVGILGYFPYQIYNLVKIIKNDDAKEGLQELD